MCVCLVYYTIILYVYINAYLYSYLYICISLSIVAAGSPTLHTPHWPGCHSGRRRIGAETWHNWFLGWLVPAARSTGIIYSKKKDLSDPIDSWWLGSILLFLNVFLQPARAINQKSFEFKSLRTINRSSWRVHHMTYWDGKGCKQRSRVKPQLARWYCSILFGVDIPLFQVAKPKHPKQYDILELFCSKLL